MYQPASVMKQNLPIVWWLVSALPSSPLLSGAMGYAFARRSCWPCSSCRVCSAALTSCRSSRSRKREKEPAQRPLPARWPSSCIEYLALIFGHRVAFDMLPDTLPGLLLNPLFILLVLSACIFPEMLIERRLERPTAL